MKILTIDDSKFMALSIKKFLLQSDPDLEIISVQVPQQGIEVFKAEKPDLLITDIVMPEMTGEEVVEKIRQFDRKTFIAVLSSNSQEPMQARILLKGANAFIKKPPTAEKLQVLLNDCRKYQNSL